VPLDEGHEHVDGVGALDLRGDLCSEPRLVLGMREQRRDGEGNRGSRRRGGRRVDSEQGLGGDDEGCAVERRRVQLGSQYRQQLVDERRLLLRPPFLWKASEHPLQLAGEVPREPFMRCRRVELLANCLVDVRSARESLGEAITEDRVVQAPGKPARHSPVRLAMGSRPTVCLGRRHVASSLNVARVRGPLFQVPAAFLNMPRLWGRPASGCEPGGRDRVVGVRGAGRVRPRGWLCAARDRCPTLNAGAA
jgi:hypothetical protein